MPFLQVTGLSKSYRAGEQPVEVLRNLDLSLEAGEMVAVMGASGVGKSTLLHVIGGLDRVDAGTIDVAGIGVSTLPDDELVAFRNRQVGFVFQFHHLLPRVQRAGEHGDASSHRRSESG